MMLALLERTHGAALAAGVAERLMHHRDRGSCGPVLREARDQARVKDPDVIRAIGIMEARIESVSSISEIAQSAEVSKRTLERKFRQVLNRSEEHTSELQSLMRISYAVFCLQKKKH